MRNLFKLFLIVGLLLSSSAVFAKDGNYAGWSPGDVQEEAEKACKVNEQLFSDDPQACQVALNQCVSHFKSCIFQCDSYEAAWGGWDHGIPFYECSDEHIAACQDAAGQEVSKLQADGQACEFHPNGKPKLDLSKVSKIDLGVKDTPQTINPINPEIPVVPNPKNPETPVTPEDPGVDTTPSNPSNPVNPGTGKEGVSEVPSGVGPVSSIAGSGCSLNLLSQGSVDLLGLGSIVLLPVLRFRKRK